MVVERLDGLAGGMGRRTMLVGAGAALALAGCAVKGEDGRHGGISEAVRSPLMLTPIRATPDRITRVTVCTRPFRPQGPRLEVERIGQKLVVHHYGHGGSGWSLSWGTGLVATEKAMALGERDIAVVGCGAIGLTTALQLQRAGAKVTIYAKDLPPDTRSSLATGVWSPDSRICLEQYATPEFKALWARVCLTSFQAYQSLLGLPGTPIEWVDNYNVADPANHERQGEGTDSRPPFADSLQHDLLPTLTPHPVDVPAGLHPFGGRVVRRGTNMVFNISSYARLLLDDFHANGGRIEVQEFHTPADFARLPQKVLVNCTGYGARALMGDASIVPVRGQLARMIPQDDVHYGLYYNGVSFVPRRDGFVFQVIGPDDYYGYNDDSVAPDRPLADQAVRTIASLFPPPAIG
ncbi:FAD-dependent oxidoreductase [Nitrospirillum pindoramense]|uniref:D-amino-acid oxidase n=1 Tax=Nitrospirillum amazonense TaxID=28077 RepID=A0A560HF68_9PROT|nr:FAD-dependent oxidoreductase [Nitrospirillum amazonense]TWB45062.1 glycine/D-amino acid oxidase-like deaminating enzyme [Nitrospirillum amazonense]